jgi:hypothetical protein
VTQADRGVVAAPGGGRYLTEPDGTSTRVHRIGADAASAVIAGRYGVPAVAQDGSASGLAADGHTLVLMHPWKRYPPRVTRLVVLDAQTLKVRERVRLAGWFGFDAISPDGRTLYFIHYRSQNTTDYEVLSYDVPAGRLDPRPIVDPREPDEKMTGIPITRLQSRDGVWAYTLYTGQETFVHALDTRDRTARCIDLPGAPTDPGRATLALHGRYVRVLYDGTPVASINPRSFGVNPAFSPRLPVHPAHAGGGGGSSMPWRLIGGIALAVALAGAAVALASRRGYAAGSDSPE